MRNEYKKHTLCGILREPMRSKGAKLKLENRHRTKTILSTNISFISKLFKIPNLSFKPM